MHVVVVLVGDELLAGHTRDANGHFLAGRLTALGHHVRRIVIVPDEPDAMVGAIDDGLQIADVVFVCGGLGPTHDDLTTEVVAERFQRRLIVDEAAWSLIVGRYGGRYPNGVPEATERSARKMVAVPEGAEILDNPVGIAPGYLVREGGRTIIVLPGVPAELQAIFETTIVGHVIPSGEARGLLEVPVFLPEADFAAALGAIAERYPDVGIGSYPHFGEKHVTLRFRGDPDRAQEALEAFYERVPQARLRS